MPHQVTVVLPASFQQYAGGQRNFSVQADSVHSALEAVVAQAADLRPHVLDETGRLRPFINVFVDSQQVLDSDPRQLPLRDGSELLIVSAVAGG